MFFMISIFLTPVFWYYKQGNGINFLSDKGVIAQFTLGNLGGAHTLCDTIMLKEKELSIKCPAGFVIATDNYIIPNRNYKSIPSK